MLFVKGKRGDPFVGEFDSLSFVNGLSLEGAAPNFAKLVNFLLGAGGYLAVFFDDGSVDRYPSKDAPRAAPSLDLGGSASLGTVPVVVVVLRFSLAVSLGDARGGAVEGEVVGDGDVVASIDLDVSADFLAVTFDFSGEDSVASRNGAGSLEDELHFDVVVITIFLDNSSASDFAGFAHGKFDKLDLPERVFERAVFEVKMVEEVIESFDVRGVFRQPFGNGAVLLGFGPFRGNGG